MLTLEKNYLREKFDFWKKFDFWIFFITDTKMLKKNLELVNKGLKLELSNPNYFGRRFMAGEWQPWSALIFPSGRLSLESPHSFPTWIVQDYLISKQGPTEFKSVSSFSPQLTVFSLLLFSQDYQNLVFNIYENVIFLIEIFLIAWIDFN